MLGFTLLKDYFASYAILKYKLVNISHYNDSSVWKVESQCLPKETERPVDEKVYFYETSIALAYFSS